MLFLPEEIEITPAARKFLASQKVSPEELLSRHLLGDWGKLGHHSDILPTLTPDEREYGHIAASEDSKCNCISVIKGSGLVLSIYPVGNEVVWVLSKLRASSATTTIMVPGDY